MKNPKLMLACDGAEFPDICLITGEPTGPGDWRKRRQLAWNPPVVYLGLLGGLLPMIILILVTQKKMHMTYSLSKAGRRKITQKRMRALYIALAAIGMIILGANLSNAAIALLAIPLLLVSLVLLCVSEPIQASSHKQGWFKIKGVSPAFLETLEQRQL